MTKAVVYMAPDCPNSKKLKEFLSGVGVEMEEKCVLTSPAVFEELEEVSGQRAIPVTVIGDEFYVGFDRRTERRMKRKLGV
ncbi:MAG: glutaredoxin family protein [Candidatus Thorarchaeota archaeon]